MRLSSAETGNAFFYVLLAVVLLAALTYAISSSLRGNSGISQERVSVIATNIIATGNRVAEAVARLRLREATKAQICFSNGTVAGYGGPAHPDCTSANTVFDFAGGGLSWETPPTGAGQDQPWGYTGNIAIAELDTAQGELVAVLPYLSLEVCQKINALLGIAILTDAPPVVAAISGANKFVGTYSSATTLGGSIKGKKAACIQTPSADGTAANPNALADANPYVYYHVLLTN